jgi:hypothetical protein
MTAAAPIDRILERMGYSCLCTATVSVIVVRLGASFKLASAADAARIAYAAPMPNVGAVLAAFS